MKIAVVVPALDEARRIEGAIQSARARGRDESEKFAGPRVEIVVVDGGSRDETVLRAREAGVRVVGSSPGRGRQLQAGVEASESDVVLFLHADSRLEPGWEVAIQEALRDPGVVGGAFGLRFDERASAALRLVEWVANLRARWLAMPYGDQAIFARRAALVAAGGVPDAVVMEDLDLVRALKRQGRIAVLPLPVTTSARRHLGAGVLRTALRHTLALLAWRLDLDRGRVAAWLRR